MHAIGILVTTNYATNMMTINIDIRIKVIIYKELNTRNCSGGSGNI